MEELYEYVTVPDSFMVVSIEEPTIDWNSSLCSLEEYKNHRDFTKLRFNVQSNADQTGMPTYFWLKCLTSKEYDEAIKSLAVVVTTSANTSGKVTKQTKSTNIETFIDFFKKCLVKVENVFDNDGVFHNVIYGNDPKLNFEQVFPYEIMTEIGEVAFGRHFLPSKIREQIQIMAFMQKSLNRDNFNVSMAVCGSIPLEEQEERQMTHELEQRLEWPRIWRCETCLCDPKYDSEVLHDFSGDSKKDKPSIGETSLKSTANKNKKLKVINTKRDDLLSYSKFLTQYLTSILEPTKFKKIQFEKQSQDKAVREAAGAGDFHSEKYEEINSPILKGCPWEWRKMRFMGDLLDVLNEISLNPALFDTSRISKPLCDAIKLHSQAKSLTESYWIKKEIEGRKAEALAKNGK